LCTLLLTLLPRIWPLCVYLCICLCVCARALRLMQTSEGKDGNDGGNENADIATCAQWCTEEGFEHVISCKSLHDLRPLLLFAAITAVRRPMYISTAFTSPLLTSHLSLSLSLSLLALNSTHYAQRVATLPAALRKGKRVRRVSRGWSKPYRQPCGTTWR
jgi:hypothetical protein